MNLGVKQKKWHIFSFIGSYVPDYHCADILLPIQQLINWLIDWNTSVMHQLLIFRGIFTMWNFSKSKEISLFLTFGEIPRSKYPCFTIIATVNKLLAVASAKRLPLKGRKWTSYPRWMSLMTVTQCKAGNTLKEITHTTRQVICHAVLNHRVEQFQISGCLRQYHMFLIVLIYLNSLVFFGIRIGIRQSFWLICIENKAQNYIYHYWWYYLDRGRLFSCCFLPVSGHEGGCFVLHATVSGLGGDDSASH